MSVARKHRLLSLCGVVGLAIIAVSGLTTVAQSGDPHDADEPPAMPPKTVRQEFMMTKLTLSQEVLRALVQNDFQLIEESARRMNVLTLAEEWGFSDSPEYTRMSEELRRISRQLTRAGKDKNIDAATLAYHRLTLNCVECHQAIRRGFKEP